ncbi:MAG TPA: universal stress protein [Frankiaceae bacterium]|nr:universal stress protein [Frankiaceae bacterium]
MIEKTAGERVDASLLSSDARREHVVVGVQGDDASLAALRWAARHAHFTGGEIEALMAWELPEPPRHLTGELKQAARGVINDLRWALETIVDRSDIAATPGIRVSTTVVTAPPKVAMADAVDRADLLVLGSVHHAAALSALSVSRQLAAAASCPVALVPVIEPRPEAGTRSVGDFLVVGMDGSPQSLDAFRWACAEAARRNLQLRVVVVSPSELALDAVTRSVAARLRTHPPLDIKLLTRAGDPGAVLIEESSGCEALILGQHGSGTIRRRLPSLGSVSRWCVVHLVSPVVVVPRRPARLRRARPDRS